MITNVTNLLGTQAKYLEPLVHGEVIEIAGVVNSREIIHCTVWSEVLLEAAQDDVIGMTD